ncbi:MAG TPA: hypothetical protein VE991_12430 [Acidimicrobiales bacterium]|nr:hypothetical protein [Acidimicrobiales bacterium]
MSPETTGPGTPAPSGDRLVFTDDDVVIEKPPARDTSAGPAGAKRESALQGLRNMATRPRAGGGGRGPRPTRARNGEGGFDLRNTWQILAGSILVPLGIVFILMAWYGAAHTAYVQQQIPYLVSGSFVGLGCLVLGGLLYWAHWLYRLYDQNDLHHEETLRTLEQTLRAFMEQRGGDNGSGGLPAPPPGGSGMGPIGGGPVASSTASGAGLAGKSSFPAPSAVPPPPPTGPTASTSGTYVVTPSGSVYHLPSCPVIAHHSEGLRVLGSAAVADMEPCRICLGPAS